MSATLNVHLLPEEPDAQDADIGEIEDADPECENDDDCEENRIHIS